MRASMALLILAPAVLGLAACKKGPLPGESARSPVAVAPAATVAERRPGLWEQRVSVGGPEAVTRICVDASTETLLAGYTSQVRGRCSKQEMAKVAEGMWKFSTVCDMGAAGQVSTEGTISGGDLSTRYQVLAQTSVLGGGSQEHQNLHVDAIWKGACPAGMKPGDAVTPDGAKVKVADLAPAPAR